MEAIVVPDPKIPGIFDVLIPATGELLTDLSVNQVRDVIAKRGLVPAQ